MIFANLLRAASTDAALLRGRECLVLWYNALPRTAHKANTENVDMKLSSSAVRVLKQMKKAENFFLSASEARANRDAMSELQDHALVIWGKSNDNEGYVLTHRGKGFKIEQ